MKRTVHTLALVAALGLALAGCSSANDSPGAEPSTPDSTPSVTALAPSTCMTGDNESQPDYIGLTEAQAEELATSKDLKFRVVGRDGKCETITMDFSTSRVNVDLVDGVVVAAQLF